MTFPPRRPAGSSTGARVLEAPAAGPRTARSRPEHGDGESFTGMHESVAEPVRDVGSGERDPRNVGAGDAGKPAERLEHPGEHQHEADEPGEAAAAKVQLVEDRYEVTAEEPDAEPGPDEIRGRTGRAAPGPAGPVWRRRGPGSQAQDVVDDGRAEVARAGTPLKGIHFLEDCRGNADAGGGQDGAQKGRGCPGPAATRP